MAEGGGLLNRYTVNTVSWVRIPSPPPPSSRAFSTDWTRHRRWGFRAISVGLSRPGTTGLATAVFAVGAVQAPVSSPVRPTAAVKADLASSKVDRSGIERVPGMGNV